MSVPGAELKTGKLGTMDTAAESEIDIDEFLIEIILNFRARMKQEITELHLPVLDPFILKKPLPLKKTKIKGMTVKGEFTDICIMGLSDFVLESLHFDFQNWSLEFHLSIPTIKIAGNYNIKAKKVVSLKDSNRFRLELTNISVKAKTCLKSSEDKRLQLVEDFSQVTYSEVEWSVFLAAYNKILIELFADTDNLFTRCFPQLKVASMKLLFNVINESLDHLSQSDPFHHFPGLLSVNEFVDSLLVNLRNYILHKEYDALDLPDYRNDFLKKIRHFDPSNAINFYGDVWLNDGRLSGLSSIYRTDKCLVKSDRTYISFSAHLGLKDLEVRYEGKLSIMDSLEFSFGFLAKVKEMSFFFTIKQSNKRGSHPKLKEFEITNFAPIHLDLSGSPMKAKGRISKPLENLAIEKVASEIRYWLNTKLERVSFPV